MPATDRGETERIWATISKDRYDQLRQWADELGIQFSQYIALVAWMGATQLRRTVHPEQYIPPEVMADAMAKATSQSFTPEVMADAMGKAISGLLEKMSPADVNRIAGGSGEVDWQQVKDNIRAMQEADQERMSEALRGLMRPGGSFNP
jgi:hypothetical protein